MTAIRAVRAADGEFVMISNKAAQDRRLSWQARGIILHVLSLPPDTPLTAKMLESEAPNGRESLRSALAELEQYGYYRRTRKSGGRGLWSWDQVISDAPMTQEAPPMAPESVRAEDASSQVSSCDGNPSDEKPSHEDTHDGKPSHVTTSGNTSFAQVSSCDGNPSDGFPSHKRSNTKNLKTKDESSSVVDQPADRSEAAPSDDDLVLNAITELIYEKTDAVVDAYWASKIRDTILGGRNPDNPVAYVRAAIEHETDPGARWLSGRPPKPWCGKCNSGRHLEDPVTRDDLGRCPDCHPAFAELPQEAT